MENINFRDPELEESFSLTCFNSSLQVFSDDDDESYIEIALEPPAPIHEGDAEDLRSCISFSSQNIILHSKTHENLGTETEIKSETETETSPSPSPSPSPSSTTMSCSTGNATSELSPLDRASKWRIAQFPSLNRLLDMLLSNLGPSSEMGEENDHPDQNGSNWKLVWSRKASKVRSRALNGGIMKLFIKFRSIKIQSLLSFVKARRVTSPQGSTKVVNINSFANGTGGEKARVVEINLDAIKGVLEAMGMSIGRKDKHTKSCPTSVKSSPIHKGVATDHSKIYTRENSVQAAIAHCKRSFS